MGGVIRDHWEFHAASESDTERLGRALARLLPTRCVVELRGTLGAGKTRLVQALAEACGIARDAVTSVTFVLSQSYHGRRSVHHFDAYRLRDEDDFRELGAEEFLYLDPETPEEAAGQGPLGVAPVTLIEWGDRVAGLLPRERVVVTIEVVGATERLFRIEGQGEREVAFVAALRADLS